MAREGKSRPAPEPTTIHEICRRYVATAATLAKVLGVPLTEAFIEAHRESIACCFIESGRAGVRLPASVTLPLLGADAPAEGNTHAEEELLTSMASEAAPMVKNASATANGHAIPTCIPADSNLPCAGAELATLRPAALAMLIAKVARLVQDGVDGWVPLLHALQAERQARLAQGPRPVWTPWPTGQSS